MMEIVGLIEDAKYYALREEQPADVVHGAAVRYDPESSGDRGANGGRLGSRGGNAPSRAVDGRQPARHRVDAYACASEVDASIVPERLVARMSTVFGLLALALAAVGLYGVVSYVTAQRTGEIGIRMALGAGRTEVQRLVLRDTLTLVLIGVAIGLPAALAVRGCCRASCTRYGPNDPLAIALALATLSATALIAGYFRRGVRLASIR